MKHLLTLVFLFWSCILQAQQMTLNHEGQFEQSLGDLISTSGQQDYILSKDGTRFLSITDKKTTLVDLTSGKTLIDYKAVDKVNSVSQIMANGANSNASASSGLNFEEGTAWYLNEDDNVLIILDFNVSQNKVAVYDFRSGELKWETGKYRYTKSMDSQILKAMIQNGISIGTNRGNVASSQRTMAQVNRQFIKPGHASPQADIWLKYIEGSGLMVLVTDEGLICLETNTGTEKWRYTDGDLNVSFHSKVEGKNQWLAMNFNASFLSSSKKIATLFDLNTGEVLNTIEFESSYKDNRTYLLGDRLILDFTSLEIYDIYSGKQLFSSIKSSTIKMGNMMSSSNAQGERNTESQFLEAIISPPYVYTMVGRSGGRNYPNDGSWKGIVLKIEINSGEEAWESEKLAKGSELVFIDSKYVTTKVKKGSGNFELVMLNANDGTIHSETEKFDNYFAREGAGLIFNNQQIMIGAKKQIYLYDIAKKSIIKEHDFAKKGLGKLRSLNLTQNAMIVYFDKGIYLEDLNGSANKSVESESISEIYFDQDLSIIYSKKSVSILNTSNLEEIGNQPVSFASGALALLNDDLNQIVFIDSDKNYKAFKIK